MAASDPTSLTPLAMDTPTPNPNSLRTRAAHITLELLFSFTTSLLCTLALLPLFGLHPSLHTVVRVTGLCTLIVFAVLDVSSRVVRRAASAAPDENPQFSIRPRRCFVRPRELDVRAVEEGMREENEKEEMKPTFV